MTLERYLSMASLTQGEFAAKLGLSQSTVSKIVLGKFKPSLSLLHRIMEASGGAVMPNDFLRPSYLDSAPPPQSQAAE